MFRMSGRARAELLGALGALAIATLCTMMLTWPTLRHLDLVVLGGGELGGWLWRYDWHFRSLEGIQEADVGLFEMWRAFVGLGRYPETGNILDVLALSYPLDQVVGFPASYNLKIFLILIVNGLCGYALGRYFSGSIAASLTAAAIAVVNPLCIQDIQACGLRQALLWWVLLYPALLDRALRRRTLPAGVLAGLCFGMAGAFYWFYGLFTGMFTLVWLIKHGLTERVRGNVVGILRALVGLGIGLAVGAGPFILPYAFGEGGAASGTRALPEMTFFLPFPPYDTVSHAPLRPHSYEENLLASIHRTISSSWTAFYPLDPTLNEGMPLAVLIFGLIPALWRRKSWGWLAIWLVFYLGTLGPFLRIGAGDAENVFKVGDDHVVRLPFTLYFQFIPGMSRMFAPYRLGAYVVVCSVALVAVGLSRFRWRAWLAPVVILATVIQPMLRLGKGAVNEGDADSRELRSPIKINRIIVPPYYLNFDRTQLGGIIEVPTDQQQDLLYYYQIEHGQKVYRSWASPGAVPPLLRPDGAGGEEGERLRYLARIDVISGEVPDAIQALSREPETAELSVLGTEAFTTWARTNNYQRIILHERGYYLVDPAKGRYLYEMAVRRLEAALGQEATQFEEIKKGDPLNPEVGVPIVGDLVPWSSQPTDLPPQRAPSVYRMAVFLVPGMDAVETAENLALAEEQAGRDSLAFRLVGPGGVPVTGADIETPDNKPAAPPAENDPTGDPTGTGVAPPPTEAPEPAPAGVEPPPEAPPMPPAPGGAGPPEAEPQPAGSPPPG